MEKVTESKEDNRMPFCAYVDNRIETVEEFINKTLDTVFENIKDDIHNVNLEKGVTGVTITINIDVGKPINYEYSIKKNALK